MRLEIRFVRFDEETLRFVEVSERLIYNAKRKSDITRKVNSYRDALVMGEFAKGEDFIVYRAMLRLSPITSKFLEREDTIHTTIHEKNGKMADVKSISTYAPYNVFCNKRMLLKKSVCSGCYARAQLRYKWGLSMWLKWNHAVLNLGILDKGDLPVIRDEIFRIEAFGDVATVFCAINYLHIFEKNKRTWFSIWTKNPNIWDRALKVVGRPKKTTFLVSSPFLNIVLKLEEVKKIYPWVDKTFTVSDDGKIVSNCAGLGCRYECGKCYGKHSHKTAGEIYENFRKVGGRKK